MTISNWNGSASCAPERMVAPRDVPELRAIIVDRAGHPSPLRAIGETHSLNGCFTTTGTIVSMKRFDRISVDLAKGEVTVGAGVRMIDLKNELKKVGRQLEVVPEIGNATAGSVACCGTKDSSLGETGLGQISSTVVGVRMVDAAGTDVCVTQALDPARLHVIRSSYGLLGVLYEVTFRIQERKKVRYRYKSVKLDRWLTVPGAVLPSPPDEEILGRADGFLGFLLPYRRRLLVERRTLAKKHRPVWAWDRVALALRTFAWKTGARPFTLRPLIMLPKAITSRLLDLWVWILDRVFLPWFFLRLIPKFVTFRADAMIDFKRPLPSYFDFTFWAFPVSSWPKVVPAYLEFCEDFRRRTGFRPALPTEVYFIRKDQNALLSFSFDEDIFTLDMVNWTDRSPECWRAMNAEFNEFAARNGARPLLNQTKEMSGPVVKLALKERWTHFVEQREKADPDGRFLNDFFRDLL